MIKEDYTTWTHEEFLTFVLIHAALADFEIQEEEQDAISKILPKERFRGLVNFHNENNDAANIDIILRLKEKFCPTPETKQELIGEIKKIFYSDGKFNLYERNMERALNLILT